MTIDDSKTTFKRLMKAPFNDEPPSLSDSLRTLGAGIEDALLESGAKAGKDYTYTDLMNWAIRIHSSSIIAGLHNKQDKEPPNAQLSKLGSNPAKAKG